MAIRKRRTDEHRRADVSLRHVQLICAKAGYVTNTGEVGSDYGLDVFVTTFDDDGYIENDSFKIQVKAPKELPLLADGQSISVSVDARDLNYWLSEISPVVLCVYGTESETAYWVHVKGYFERQDGFSLKNLGKQATIHLSVSDVLDPAAIKLIRGIKNTVVARENRGFR